MKRKSPGTKVTASTRAAKTITPTSKAATAKKSGAKAKPAKVKPVKAAKATTAAKPRPKPRATKPAGKSTPAAKKKTPAKPAPAPKKNATAASAAPDLSKGLAHEAIDAAEPKATAVRAAAATTRAAAATPLRNSDFPRTYLKSIHVSLNDPDHAMTFTWAGPKAASQETGPFRTSPGAGLKGLNCDNTATSRTSGSLCTPKGTHKVQGFQARLNSDARATNVTWFVRSRGIAFHYFPSVPKFAASHGCVRIEQKRIAQLIQENARIDLTTIVIDGTWTKPAKQW